jgi:4-amino-4-deoxychorismate lyase
MKPGERPAAGPCWVDGEAGESLPVLDRGLQFGDGLFETFAVVAGGIPRWPAHLARLGRGIERLGLAPLNLAAVDEEVRRLVAQTGGDWVGKLILTRGSSARGYRLPAQPAIRRILTLNRPAVRPARYWREGVPVRLCGLRLGTQPALAGLKHLNRLESLLARAEWSGDDPPEGLMCDQQGRLVEGTMSNLFIRFGPRVLTSPLQDCGVSGTQREWVIEQLAAEERFVIAYETIEPAALAGADEVFLSNSLFGLWPVRCIEGQAGPGWPVGECLRLLQAASLRAMPWLRSAYDGPLD